MRAYCVAEQFIIGSDRAARRYRAQPGFRFHHAMYQEVLYAFAPTRASSSASSAHRCGERRGYGERAAEVATELAHAP